MTFDSCTGGALQASTSKAESVSAGAALDVRKKIGRAAARLVMGKKAMPAPYRVECGVHHPIGECSKCAVPSRVEIERGVFHFRVYVWRVPSHSSEALTLSQREARELINALQRAGVRP